MFSKLKKLSEYTSLKNNYKWNNLKCMKYIISIFCLLITGSIFSQENNKWAVEFSTSIDRYFIDVDQYERFANSEFTGFSLDKQKLNYTLGLSILRNLNPKTTIGTGLQYSNRDFEGHCYCDFCNKATIFNQLISLRFIEIPVFINYTLGKDSNALKPYLKAGVTTSKVMNESFANAFRNFHFSGMLGIGGQYSPNERLTMYAESFYEQMLRTVSDYSEYTYKSVSLQVGLRTSF